LSSAFFAGLWVEGAWTMLSAKGVRAGRAFVEFFVADSRLVCGLR